MRRFNPKDATSRDFFPGRPKRGEIFSSATAQGEADGLEARDGHAGIGVPRFGEDFVALEPAQKVTVTFP